MIYILKLMFILGIIHFRTCKFTVIGLDFKNEKKIIPGACGWSCRTGPGQQRPLG